jgi:hypothetical protein
MCGEAKKCRGAIMDEVRVSENNEAAAIMNAVRRYFSMTDSQDESTESSILKALMTYFNESGDQL